MKNVQLDLANRKLNEHLLNSQLDRLIVSSVELRLCFLIEALPKREIWVTVTGAASIDEDVESRSDFFVQRSRFISQVYLLIGKIISDVEVNEYGQLKILINSSTLIIEPDNESFEEVWSVTPDSSLQFGEYDWFVTYTDERELLVK